MERGHGAVAHDHGAPGRRGGGSEGTEPGEAARPDTDPRACPASREADHEIARQSAGSARRVGLGLQEIKLAVQTPDLTLELRNPRGALPVARRLELRQGP